MNKLGKSKERITNPPSPKSRKQEGMNRIQNQIRANSKPLGGKHVERVKLERKDDKTRWITMRGFNQYGTTSFSQHKLSSEGYVRGKLLSPDRERQPCKEVTKVLKTKEFPIPGWFGDAKRQVTVVEPGKNMDAAVPHNRPAKAMNPAPSIQVLDTGAGKKSIRAMTNLRNQAILKKNKAHPVGKVRKLVE